MNSRDARRLSLGSAHLAVVVPVASLMVVAKLVAVVVCWQLALCLRLTNQQLGELHGVVAGCFPIPT